MSKFYYDLNLQVWESAPDVFIYSVVQEVANADNVEIIARGFADTAKEALAAAVEAMANHVKIL